MHYLYCIKIRLFHILFHVQVLLSVNLATANCLQTSSQTHNTKGDSYLTEMSHLPFIHTTITWYTPSKLD